MLVSLFAVLPQVLFTTRTPAAPNAGDTLSVMPFLALARELAALLLPVQPRPQFRQDLERSLMAAARQQSAHNALIGQEQFPCPSGRGPIDGGSSRGSCRGGRVRGVGREYRDLCLVASPRTGGLTPAIANF